MHPIHTIRDTIRNIMSEIARFINEMSGGRVHPNHITYLSLAGHVLIAATIIYGRWESAALFLVAFGLMDALDGALARELKIKSKKGVVLDAVTDRMKESLLYVSIVYIFARDVSPEAAMWAAAAVTGSIVVSYIRARGETVLAQQKDININQVFKNGLLSYEIRMFILVVGLLSSQLEPAIIVIAIGSWLTAFFRFGVVLKSIK